MAWFNDNILDNGFLERAKNGLKGQGVDRLAGNFASLSILQIVNYALPLITLPYLVRVLGVEKFGLVMFAVSFIQYFLMLTDYGFSLSATREISIHRDDKSKVSEIFFSVMIIKGVLTLVSFIIMAAILLFFDKFRGDWLIYIFTFGIVAGQSLFPIWFFQGMEKMKYITILNITAKTIFTALIFIFIREQSDYLYVPIFNSMGYLTAGVISIWIVFKYFKIQTCIPGLACIYGYFKDSTQFFLSRVSVTIYTSSNTFIVGLLLGNVMVGYYAAAEKLFTAIKMIYSPLTTALYPYMCKAKNLKLYKKIFIVVFILNMLVSGFVFIFSDFIVNLLYGEGFEITVNLLRMFSILSIIIVPAILLGYPLLAAMGHPKIVNFSVIIASGIHLAMLLAIIPIINVYLVALITIITQIIVIGIRVYGIKKYIKDPQEEALCAE